MKAIRLSLMAFQLQTIKHKQKRGVVKPIPEG